MTLRPFSFLGVSIENTSVGSFEEIGVMLDIVANNDLQFCIETLPINETNIGKAFKKVDDGEARYKITLVDYDKQFGN